MSEYTPTKLEVRAQYAKDSTGSDEYIRAIGEFDRWLEAHAKVVAKNVQDRIIKNIQSRISDLRARGKRDNCQELAALIESYIPEWTEGEQK